MNENKEFAKGDIIKVDIIDINEDGTAVAKHGNLIVFVKGGVPGDILYAEVTKVKKNYAEAVMLNIISESKYRKKVEELCPYQERCGGCTFGRIKYEEQLNIKEKHLRQKLMRVGDVQNPVIENIIPSPNTYFYRNKATLAVEKDKRGNVNIGFYQNKTHSVINIDSCMIQHLVLAPIIQVIRNFIKSENIPVFNDFKREGLRNITVKTAFGSGQVMVILGIYGKSISNMKKLAYLLDEAVYGLNYDFRKTKEYLPDLLYSLESIVIKDLSVAGDGKGTEDDVIIDAIGKKVIEDITSRGLKYEISSEAFYQVNPAQTENLYAKAIEYAGINGGENILDIYCGIGTVGITALSYIGFSGKILGIELSERAVRDANRNVVINKIIDARYIAGKAENVVMGLSDKNNNDFYKLMEEMCIEKFDVAFLDPPRSGCREELLHALVRMGIKRIVYISCDAATLSRDIKYLCNNGYEFKKAVPVDMFCQTGRLEAVALLENIVNNIA